jgi:hypothetical protein
VTLAALETVTLVVGGHASLSVAGLTLVLFRFALGALLWAVVLMSARLLLRAGSRGGPLLRSIASLSVIVVLFLLLVADACSLGLLISTGSFAERELLLFGVTNLWQLNLHFLQTFAVLWLTILGGSALVAVTLERVLVRTVPQTRPLLRRLLALAVCIGALLVAPSLAGHPPGQVAARAHPFLAAFTGSGGVETSVLPGAQAELQPRGPGEYAAYSSLAVKTPVIVIMIESLRHDLWDVEPCPVPFLASLRDDSLVFTRPYAVSSHSDYEDLSVWYSRYPLRGPGRTVYKADSPTRGDSVFKIFKLMGYHTAYISSQNEKWGGMINWLRVAEVDHFWHSEDYEGPTWENQDDEAGLLRLMKTRIATAGKVEDSATLAVAADWIAALEAEAPFFLGLNLQNTHFNYVIPEGGPEPFQPSVIDFPTPYFTWPEERVVDVRNRYLNACYNLDLALAEFARRLSGLGVWDRSLVVILGDSGEAFYEHGFGNHSGPMYEEVVRTLGLIKLPRGSFRESLSARWGPRAGSSW